LERRYRYQARGYDFGLLVAQVAELIHLEPDKVARPGRYPETAEARSVQCYWAGRELGITALGLSKHLGISQPTASRSGKRCEKVLTGVELVLLC
jgi:chemotaxis signal transduction protein